MSYPVPQWKSFTPAGMVPSAVTDLVSGIDSLASTLSGLLDTAAGIVDLVATFMSGFADPQKMVIDALIEAIESAVQQLTQTGIYMCPHYPMSEAQALSPGKWLSDVADSLDDAYDGDRPVLVDPSCFVGAVVVMGVAPDLRTIYEQFKDFLALMGIGWPTLAQIRAWILETDGASPEPEAFGSGEVPNWSSLRLVDVIKPLGDIAQVLLDFVELIRSAVPGSEVYARFAALLRSKAELLRAFSNTLSGSLSALALALATQGLYLLPICGQGDSTWVQNALRYSEGGPLALGTSQCAAGIMFLAVGPTTGPRDALLGLFMEASIETEMV